MANRVSKRNNVLKALAGTNLGHHKEILLLTYKPLGRCIVNYAAPVWLTNASDSSINKIQCSQNEALRIITGSYKMSSMYHFLSAQYLIYCLDTESVCQHITTMDHPHREMKETLFTRHNQTVLSFLTNTKKDSHHAIHTSFPTQL